MQLPEFLPEPFSQGSFKGTQIFPKRPGCVCVCVWEGGAPKSLLASPHPPPPLPS